MVGRTLAIELTGMMAMVGLGLQSAALAGEISEPAHGVSAHYDDALWTAWLGGGEINLFCRDDRCGDGTVCAVSETPVSPNLTAQSLFSQYGRDFTNEMVKEFESHGFDPEMVDRPATVQVGSTAGTLSSIGYMQGGSRRRAWFAALSEPFGVALVSCYGAEEQFETVKASWLAVAEGITTRKN